MTVNKKYLRWQYLMLAKTVGKVLRFLRRIIANILNKYAQALCCITAMKSKKNSPAATGEFRRVWDWRSWRRLPTRYELIAS
ncbi:hypothetical protein RZ62_08210 [[Haemophilus] ducreyi]|nr:hypothetical protein RZ62_08210 [[Haemophilus] ducreyi]